MDNKDCRYTNCGYNRHERDVRIGLIDAGARYYTGAKRKSRMGGNPWLGRWLSVDPLGLKYVSLTTYQCAGNNPLMLVAPTGKAL